MSHVDADLGLTDSDPDYDPLTDDDAELRGFLFPWAHASANASAHVNDDLKPPSGGGGGGGGGSTLPVSQAVPDSLHAGPSFASVGADNGGSYMIPPDSASAVSGSAVILATNGEIQVYGRSPTSNTAMTLIKDASLDSFFGASGLFDPRVIYDPHTGKLIVAAVDQDGGANTSHVWVAVSTDATATSFNISSFDTALSVNNNLSWADFPQVGLDNGGNLYLTANMFGFSSGSFQGSRLWVVNEDSVGAAPTLSPTAIDASAAAGFGSDLFSLAPANMPGAGGEYLVAYNSARNAAGHNVLDIIYVDSQGHAAGHWDIDVGLVDQNKAFGGLTAPQPGTTKALDADDSRVASVVWQNGHLYVAADILPVSGKLDAGHTTAHWWALSADPSSTASTAPYLVDQGDISGNAFHSGSALRSYYPSLAVGANGELAVSFSGSGPSSGSGYTGNPSAYEATIANPLDTANPYQEDGAWQLLEAGQANYYRTFGGSDNRWGDYSSISVDPRDQNSFWAFNEYAMTHGISFGGQNGLWGTELGLFH